PPPELQDLWYVRFKNADGKWAKAKLTRVAIVDRWRSRALGEDAGVSNNPNGPFLPLREVFAEAGPAEMPKRLGLRRLSDLGQPPVVYWVGAVAAIMTAIVLAIA